MKRPRPFTFGVEPAPVRAADAAPAAQRTTSLLPADAPHVSPAWAARPTLPMPEQMLPPAPVLPFRAVAPAPRTERQSHWPAFIAWALAVLLLCSLALVIVLLLRPAPAPVATATSPFIASAPALPAPSVAPTVPASAASVAPPHVAPSASAPAVRPKAPRARGRLPPLPFGGSDTHNPWSYN